MFFLCTDAIHYGQLIIGVSKFDRTFEVYTKDTRQKPVTEEIVKAKVLKCLEDAIPRTSMSEGNIIPLCGTWALAASKLATSMMGDQSEELMSTRLADARTMLEKCPNLDLPGGQGQSQKDLIIKLDSTDVNSRLEKASGFWILKNR